MPNTLGQAETGTGVIGPGFVGTQAPGIFGTTVSGIGDVLGSVRDNLVNGIPRLIDGLIEREVGVDQDRAGFAPVGDNRAERVAPQDTAPRSVVPFVDFTDRNTQLTAGAIAVAAAVAFFVLRK